MKVARREWDLALPSVGATMKVARRGGASGSLPSEKRAERGLGRP